MVLKKNRIASREGECGNKRGYSTTEKGFLEERANQRTQPETGGTRRKKKAQEKGPSRRMRSESGQKCPSEHIYRGGQLMETTGMKCKRARHAKRIETNALVEGSHEAEAYSFGSGAEG